MHKSIILLLGLLTFLIPVGPSSMSNSNVMAIDEDYDYEADQYERYATAMANDNYYKSQGSDFIKKIKCNNINVNLNGIDVDLGVPNGNDLLNGPIDEAQAEDESQTTTTASSFGNNEINNNGYKQNEDFRFICINNNNNAVVNETTTEPPEPPEPLTCEDCFTANLNETELNNVEVLLQPST